MSSRDGTTGIGALRARRFEAGYSTRTRESSFTHSSRNYLLLIVILFAHAYTSLKYLKLILFLVVVVLEIVLVVVIAVAEFILLLARLRHEWKLHLFRILIEPI